MKFFLVGIHLLLGLNVCVAQGLLLSDVRASGKPLTADADGTVTGTPYLHDTWANGMVYITEKIKSDNTWIRYDIYTDRVEVKEKENVFTLDPIRIKGFKYSINIDEELQERHFRNGFTQIKPASPASYFEVLFEGKNTFLKRYTKKLGYDATSYGSSSSKSFQDQSMFYVLKANGEVVEFAETKKALLKAFPLNEKEISTFIKQNQIKVSDSEDMKKLSAYLDTLTF